MQSVITMKDFIEAGEPALRGRSRSLAPHFTRFPAPLTRSLRDLHLRLEVYPFSNPLFPH